MLAKLSVLVVSMALCLCALLAARQMRMQAAHELTEARLRVMRHDNDLWRVRAHIAARITPQEVEKMAAEVNPLKPMAGDVPPPIVLGDRGSEHPR